MSSNDIEPITEPEIMPAGTAFAMTTDSNSALEFLGRQVEVMAAAHRLATALCKSELVPAMYRGKPDNGAAAILYGAELGLNPVQSLQQVFVVHGTPAIYSRTMVALLTRKGYRIRTDSSTDESVTVSGQAPDGMTETSIWTMERARKAGYVPEVDEKTGKFKTNANGKLIGNEKYLKDPQAMLYAKAAAEVCRKLAPDVLLGISHTREELESEPDPARAEFVAGPRRGIAGLREKLGVTAAPPPPAAEETAEPEPAAAVDFDSLLDTVALIEDVDDLETLWNEHSGALSAADKRTFSDMVKARKAQLLEAAQSGDQAPTE